MERGKKFLTHKVDEEHNLGLRKDGPLLKYFGFNFPCEFTR